MNRISCRLPAPAADRPLRRLWPAACGLWLAAATVSALPLHRDTLPNGLPVLTYVDHRLPMIDLMLVCRSGSTLDPEGKSGLAGLTVDLLTRSTRRMTGDSVASLVEFLGAEFSPLAGLDNSKVSIRALSKDLEQALDLLAAAVREPAFTPADFELSRARARAQAQRRSENPGSEVGLEFNRLLHGASPYGLPPGGDTLSLALLRPEDAVAFHRDHYVPNNCFLVAVGAVEHQDLLDRVQSRLGDWPRGQVPALTLPEPVFPGRLRVKHILRPGMNQTYIMFGHPGISMSAPDRVPLNLGNSILGGGASASRLGDVVREAAGLAYDVRSVFAQNRDGGEFWASVQTARPAEALKLMFSEIERFTAAGPTEHELTEVKDYFLGSFPLRYSSNRGKLWQVEAIELYGLGLDWLERYPEEVRAATLSDVKAAIGNRIRPGRYVMVVLGNVTREELGLGDVEWIE